MKQKQESIKPNILVFFSKLYRSGGRCVSKPKIKKSDLHVKSDIILTFNSAWAYLQHENYTCCCWMVLKPFRGEEWRSRRGVAGWRASRDAIWIVHLPYRKLMVIVHFQGLFLLVVFFYQKTCFMYPNSSLFHLLILFDISTVSLFSRGLRTQYWAKVVWGDLRPVTLINQS